MAMTMAQIDTDIPATVAAAATAAPPPASPRKRRRRAPTTGAADDCFACQDRHTQCDRRRPYCSQCLERGKDCSGYKTTLTWGVGVASRGKLRGLALPIAKSKKVAPVEGAKVTKKGSASSAKSKSSSVDSKETSFASPTIPTPMSTTFGFVNVDPNAPAQSPMNPPASYPWPQSAGTHAQHARRSTMHQPPSSLPQPQRLKNNRPLRRHSLEPLHVPAAPLPNYGNMPMTANMFGGYGNHQYVESPVQPIYNTYGQMPIFKNYLHQQVVASPMEGDFFPQHHVNSVHSWSSENVSTISSEQSNYDQEQFMADPVVANTLDNLIDQVIPNDDMRIEEIDREDDNEYPSNSKRDSDMSLAISRAIPTLNIGKTPGLRFHINYYDKVISPVIVAFDGPTNPYRTHILKLAAESETLQHAIAALSASNLRMRREHNPMSLPPPESTLDSSHDESVRNSSIAHRVILNKENSYNPEASTDPGVPSAEELYHKEASIRALNAQLADPLRRKDDSILATLLVLCLYHICDTGVAKFKTQFAGVKKILALRGDLGSGSKETNWLTIMFKWFDAMTASVNDREGQFHPSLCDTSALENEEWALENLAGCDGRLFQTISKLGRLNLLSQNKPVTDLAPNAAPKPKSQPLPRVANDYYSMTNNYNRFDGNGWAPLPEDYQPYQIIDPDSRTQFWREWNEIRQKLSAWQPDDTALPVPLATSDTRANLNRQDLRNISESFRYSALLYTERLAHPSLPSTHLNFQDLVGKSLFFITNVKSDVYLLWPLFITGTECFHEEHRNLIRRRCLDIQKDSGFFNNISCLELLEKIWRDQDLGLQQQAVKEEGDIDINGMPMTNMKSGYASSSSGFSWRKAMLGKKVEGEYIVI
ncbi:MAG: hypothetical protein MMC33_001780 [Icmadophila ericetorum]|nr:hypothetical protein [Icmadophila ericetorum]